MTDQQNKKIVIESFDEMHDQRQIEAFQKRVIDTLKGWEGTAERSFKTTAAINKSNLFLSNLRNLADELTQFDHDPINDTDK